MNTINDYIEALQSLPASGSAKGIVVVVKTSKGNFIAAANGDMRGMLARAKEIIKAANR